MTLDDWLTKHPDAVLTDGGSTVYLAKDWQIRLRRYAAHVEEGHTSYTEIPEASWLDCELVYTDRDGMMIRQYEGAPLVLTGMRVEPSGMQRGRL